ncbi:PAAR-like domain-containing protein [Gymnodinialimonas sp. 2305UL16-5]|uniref:PAAR-like domain-containing protein n=1 Tax=Gymnodinialimonas mytili TaxID=3126503 RepID=UPI0030A68F5A
MQETVAINGLTLCHKNASGFVQSTLPDVCKAPKHPAPFTNVAFAKDLAKGTTTVHSHGGAMCGIKGSEFSTSIGDEPGVGKGVKSGTQLDRATFLSWSPNVFMEGKPVTRLTDRMLLNNGNTISAGGYYTGPVTGTSRATLDLLCEIACRCLNNGNQNCVDTAVQALPRTPETGLYSEVTFTPAGVMLRNPDGSPQTRYGVAGSRIDITGVVGGAPTEFVEMKFPGDRLRNRQQERYGAAAARNGRTLTVLEVPGHCNNCEGQRQEEQSSGLEVNPWAVGAVGGLILLGICIYATAGVCGLAAAGGGLAAAS